jgi:hypothetical protein
MTTQTPRTDAVWKANTDIEGCITNIEPIYAEMTKMEQEISYLRFRLIVLHCDESMETT